MVYFTAAAAFAFALSLAILYSKPEPLMGDAIALARSCFVFRGYKLSSKEGPVSRYLDIVA
jgi:hypothetical protein